MSNPPLPPEHALEPEQIQLPVTPRGLQFTSDDLKARESKTAQTIAITLIVMLGATFVANVVTLIVLTVKNRLDAVPSFERMFAVWVPLLSGLVGSAVTFYLTKEKR